MKSNAYISISSTIKLVIWTAVSIIMIAISFYVLDDIAKQGGDWLNTTITAIGNFSGGIIGGIVAYIVASFQIKKSADIQDKVHQREIHAILRLINEEISYNKDVLQAATPYTKEANEYLAKHLQMVQWTNLSSKIGAEIDDEDFINLCDYYRQINFMKNSSSNTDESIFNTASELTSKLSTCLKEKVVSIKSELNQQ